MRFLNIEHCRLVQRQREAVHILRFAREGFEFCDERVGVRKVWRHISYYLRMDVFCHILNFLDCNPTKFDLKIIVEGTIIYDAKNWQYNLQSTLEFFQIHTTSDGYLFLWRDVGGRGVWDFVTKCDEGGGGGQKIPKKAWRHIWMAPYSMGNWV